MSRVLRVLLVADTHLGYDLPFHPRVERRRRGDDFFANLDLALRPALRGEVDLVVHGGDLLYRSRVPPALVDKALAPLLHVAESGVPVFLVPGNHERSRIPLQLWALHPNLHIFDQPHTFHLSAAGSDVALAGFPFVREVRDRFLALVEQTGFRQAQAGVRLLCIHQVVEGAVVGPGGYTFRANPDVVRGRDIPGGFAAVLAGHIHRPQVLTRDLSGRLLAAPVVYPGSVERTAFAERYEPKVYALISVDPTATPGPRPSPVPLHPPSPPPHTPCSSWQTPAGHVHVEFVPLPARPMLVLALEPAGAEPEVLERQVRQALEALDSEAVVRLELRGPQAAPARALLSAAALRSLAPPTMNVELAPDRQRPAGLFFAD